MSDIHVRETDRKLKSVNCVFHIDVPVTSNAVGVIWTEVVQKARLPEPIMADNDTTENAKITAGEILEVAATVRFSSINLTNAQRLAEIEAFYNDKKAEYMTKLQGELNFFGKEITV